MRLDLRDRIAGRIRGLVTPTLERGAKHATILAISSSKGGVGKTTTAVNLSAACAQGGLKTLLVDLDPQAHVAAALKASARRGGGSLSDVLLGRIREVCEVVEESGYPDLDLAGSDKSLAETEMILAAKIGKELILAGALEITRSRYDLIVLDCPPNLGTLTLNALCCADALLIPSDMSALAVEGIGDILTVLDTVRERLGRKIRLAGIVATRYDRRVSRTNDAIVQGVVNLFGECLLETRIPQSSSLNRAHMAGKPIFAFAPRSPGANAYAELAREVARLLGLKLAAERREEAPSATTREGTTAKANGASRRARGSASA